MRIGAVFPQTEIGGDPGVIREYVTAVEEMGFDHLVIYDHVLGASVANRPDWRGPYTSETPVPRAVRTLRLPRGLTTRLELVTGVIILPQRQTVLVAKQAAEVDVLERRAHAPGRRHRLERGRVRGAQRGLPHARTRGWRSRSRCCARSGRSRW